MRFIGKEIDWYLAGLVITLSFFGLFHLYTLSTGDFYYFNRQLVWIGIGIFLLFFFSSVSADFISKLTPFAYLAAIFLLVVVLFKGEITYGARRWLQIGAVEFQPSEFAKAILILSLAKLLSDREHIGWKLIFLSLFLTVPFLILIAAQPDLGMALIFAIIWLIVLFAAGTSLFKFFSLVGVICACFPLSYFFFLHSYQRARILTFLYPRKDPLGAGWSALQSKIALGSGGLFGKGIGEAAHTQLRYLPQPFTDFIFSSIGEEWGFVGTALVIVVYVIIVARGALIALRSGNSFSGLFATGFTSLIVFQAFVNIGMASGILPVTGIPLPYISYGGSSTILFLSGVGIMLALNRKE